MNLVATFYCEQSYPMHERHGMVFVGRIVNGKVKTGMRVVIEFNPAFSVCAPITCIGLRYFDDVNSVISLEIACEDDDGVAFWVGTNIHDEEISIIE